MEQQWSDHRVQEPQSTGTTVSLKIDWIALAVVFLSWSNATDEGQVPVFSPRMEAGGSFGGKES